MFLIRWIRILLSLPLQWAGQLAGILGLQQSAGLLTVAWRISEDGETGSLALAAIGRYGSPDQQIATGLAWLDGCPRVEIAGLTGLAAMQVGDEPTARDMLQQCGQLGGDRDGLAEMLELLVARRFGEFGETTACARRLEPRDDLSPTVSRMIGEELLWDAMLHGRLDEARRRAERILAVGDNPSAGIALAALGGYDPGESPLPPAQDIYYRFLAAVSVGATARAEELIGRLDQLDPSLAGHAVVTVQLTRGDQWT